MSASSLPALLPSDAGNLYGSDTGREHLSHSSLSWLLACPQKYGFGYEEKIALRARPAALSLGAAYQTAIELNDPQAGANRLRAEAKISSQVDEDRVRVQETIVRAASGLYLATYPHDDSGVSRKEYAYLVRLRNPWTGHYSQTYDLLGYADELTWDATSDTWLLTENKLVGQISELSIRRLPLDRQIALACYGIWRATGAEVARVAYRMMRKPSIKQKKSETLDEFCERLEADYTERPEFYLVEETWARSTADLVRVEAELWLWAGQLREQRRALMWARNTSQCTEYGGCPFIPLCLGEPGAEGLYEPKEPFSQTAEITPVRAA